MKTKSLFVFIKEDVSPFTLEFKGYFRGALIRYVVKLFNRARRRGILNDVLAVYGV